MDHSLDAYECDWDAGFIHFAGIGFAFVTEDIVLGCLYQCWRQTFEVAEGGFEGGGVDVVALFWLGDVAVPEPHHHVFG